MSAASSSLSKRHILTGRSRSASRTLRSLRRGTNSDLNFHLNVSMVAMKRNVGGLVEFVEAAHSYGAESIGVSHVTVFEERDKFDSLFWWPKETNDIIARGRKRAKELGMAFYAPPPFAVTPNEIATYKTAPLPPCPYLRGRIYVGFAGRIEACAP